MGQVTRWSGSSLVNTCVLATHAPLDTNTQPDHDHHHDASHDHHHHHHDHEVHLHHYNDLHDDTLQNNKNIILIKKIATIANLLWKIILVADFVKKKLKKEEHVK